METPNAGPTEIISGAGRFSLHIHAYSHITGSQGAGVLLSYLAGKSRAWNQWFYRYAFDIEEDLNISERTRQRQMKILKERGFVDVVYVPDPKPARNRFRINEAAIRSALLVYESERLARRCEKFGDLPPDADYSHLLDPPLGGRQNGGY